MLTYQQTNTLARGLRATVERTNERVTTVRVIEHESNVSAAEVLRVVKHVTITSGVLHLGRGSIQIGVSSGGLDVALTQSEAHVERLRVEVERLRQQLPAQDERVNGHRTGL